MRDSSRLWRVLAVATLLVACVGGASAATVIEDFEDGDVTEWSGDTAGFTAQSNTVVSGSYTGRLESSNENVEVYRTFNSVSGDFLFTVRADKDTGTSEEAINVLARSGGSTGDIVFTMRWMSGNGAIEWYDGGYQTVKSSWSPDTNYKVRLAMDYANSQAEVFINGQSYGNYNLRSTSVSSIDYLRFRTRTSSSGATNYGFLDDVCEGSCNTPPQFNSSSVTPDPPLIGENVSYSAEVYDSDGSIQYTNLSLSGVCSASDLKRTGTTPSWNDVCTPSSLGWLNATLETVDDAGAVTTKEINRYLADTAPQVSIVDPGNQTYWMYDVPLQYSVSDSDSDPGEDWNCNVDKDGSLYKQNYLKEGTNSTVSDTLRSNLGSHTTTVSCTDGSGNTGSQNVDYTVDNFRIQGTSSSSWTYETEETGYWLDIKLGEMVQNISAVLNYNQFDREKIKQDNGDGINTYSLRAFYQPSLVDKNATSNDWYYKVDVNYTGFSGNYLVEEQDSNVKQQKVYWAFYIKNHSLSQARYAGGSDIHYTGFVVNKTPFYSVEEKSIVNNQTGIVKSLDSKLVSDSITEYTGSAPTDYINEDVLGVKLDPSYQIEFRNEQRDLNASNLSLKLDRLELNQCSNSGGEKALVFTTYQETDRDNTIKSELNAAMHIWNPDQPSEKKAVNFSTTGTSHNFCIEPGYATLQADSTEKLIQYTDTADNYVLRSYFLINQTLTNDTTNIPLYMLPKNKSSRVKFKVQNENREPVSGAVIKIKRYFPGVDKLIPVAMVKTGAEGQTETYLQVNEIYYGFNIYTDSMLQKTVPQQVIPSDLSLKFTLGDTLESGYYDYKGKVGYSCEYNATRVSCSYDSQTEGLENMTLTVEEKQPIGYSIYDSKTMTTSTGTITIKGFNASKKLFRFSLEADFKNGISDILKQQRIGEEATPFGKTGLFLALLQFLVMSFAGLWKPSASITLGMFSLVISAVLPFMAIPQTALTAMIALGAVLIWRMN